MKFYSVYALLIITCLLLSGISIQLCIANPSHSTILEHFLVGVIWGFNLLGVGFGFIILLIATLFSWVQLYLLVTGSVDPHMVKSDFFKVLETFLNHIFSHPPA